MERALKKALDRMAVKKKFVAEFSVEMVSLILYAGKFDAQSRLSRQARIIPRFEKIERYRKKRRYPKRFRAL